MKKPLFRLLYTVKMIFDVSTFYNRLIIIYSCKFLHVLRQSGEGGLPHREDHQPSDPELQALHHRKWKLDDMGSGKILPISTAVKTASIVINLIDVTFLMVIISIIKKKSNCVPELVIFALF